MKEFAVAFLALALVFVGGLGGGYILGGRDARATAKAEKAQALQAQQKAIDQAVAQARADGDDTVRGLREQAALASRFTATLDERRRHAQLTVPTPRCPGAAPAATVPVQGGQPALQVAEVAPVDPELSLAAVSLWNSALAGGDVPAGACRAAGTDDAACAAGAGLGVKHAWDNQAVNAASCLADRQRATALIALLCKRPGQPGCNTNNH